MSTKKILTIQFRSNLQAIAAERSNLEREVGIYVEVEYINALDDEIDWNHPQAILADYKGLILGGSGEFDFDGKRSESDPAKKTSYALLEKLKPLFEYVFENDIPTLGICYGHQILGAFRGAQVCCDEIQKKTGSYELKLMVDRNDYFLFSDLPNSFFAHYGHKDALDRVPDGAVLIMNGGEQCKVSALKYQNNIYSTQFHPEFTYEQAVDRIKKTPGYLPEGVVAEEIFKDEPHSNTILQNFGKFVAMQ